MVLWVPIFSITRVYDLHKGVGQEIEQIVSELSDNRLNKPSVFYVRDD